MLDNQKVKVRMSEILGINLAKIKEEVILSELVMDSFILIDMVIDLQNTFGVRLNQEDLIPVKTVGDLLTVLNSKVL
jgi:acyl carrier protein